MERLFTLENEIKELRKTLKEKEDEVDKIRKEVFSLQKHPYSMKFTTEETPAKSSGPEPLVKNGKLPKWAIERYSRQILLRYIGMKGQIRICEAKVLIVGAGGMGCPAAMYLAGAGVGEIGIIDYDVVELTNRHRQILHFEQDENTSKAESAAATLRDINSRIKITPYKVQLNSKNALEIASRYDVILDCTDNERTRYLLSDLSCLIKKPLISGSVLKMEGQLTVYGYRSDTNIIEKGKTYRGPCYRCLFPTPPSPDDVVSCSSDGAAGPVSGIIGTLQAMEALKCILDLHPGFSLLVERMFIFNAEDMVAKTVRLRQRNPMCAACSDNPTITRLVDEAYCMAPANDKEKQDEVENIRQEVSNLCVTSMPSCASPKTLAVQKTEKEDEVEKIRQEVSNLCVTSKPSCASPKTLAVQKTIQPDSKTVRKFTTEVTPAKSSSPEPLVKNGKLSKWAIERYSRQILLPVIGMKGQIRICEAKVLIVGAGGLGCPAAMYLAGAGVGEIGIVDYDVVNLTNIHRQILHYERDENTSKAQSAAATLRSINSRIKITPYKVQLDSKNALEIASRYDVILDCSRNLPTRYLLNDLCCLTKKPLIWGMAFKMEGQLTIYGYRSDTHTEKGATYRGPCCRCLYPTPPSPEEEGFYFDEGIVGPVTGITGTLQAMEALKFILGMPPQKLLVERKLIFNAKQMHFIEILSKRNPKCAACSDKPTIKHLVNYEVFCIARINDKKVNLKLLSKCNRLSAVQVSQLLKEKNEVYMVDVRADSEFQMCHIWGAHNWSVSVLIGDLLSMLLRRIEETSAKYVIFVSRRGNSSQLAAHIVLDELPKEHRHKVKDMIGGLHAWASDVDPTFPVY